METQVLALLKKERILKGSGRRRPRWANEKGKAL